MFTGLIEDIGVVEGSGGGTLTVRSALVLEDMKLGDSVATNGVCLTVMDKSGSAFSAHVMPETLRRSNLGALKKGDRVNLERAMPADGRFGGHLVSGHIDGAGAVRSLKNEGNAMLINIEATPEILKYVVQKGSICIDGISLTVVSVASDSFMASIIPHTGQQTTLLVKRAGDIVNIECDIIGKYVEKLLKQQGSQSRIDMSFLEKCGY